MQFGKQWSNETMVWVTDWGHAVHNNPSCPGIAAFGSKDQSTKVRLDNRLCAVRRACKKCFGEYCGDDSLRALDRLIEKLHGKVDIDQKARTLIATTARLRFGDSNARPPVKTRSSTSKQPVSSAVISSRGRTKPTKLSAPRPSLPKATLPTPPPVSKAEAKRRRDRAAAARLNITVDELKARRRQENEARNHGGTSSS